MSLLPCSYAAAIQNSPHNIQFFLDWHQQGDHLGSTPRGNYYLYRLIDCILVTSPKLGPDFLKKVDIADAYMHTWFLIEDVVFLVPKATIEQ